ncbi:hypothetical protein HOY80DRAFT_960344 [Tuber brumale]|nr:hypothetical protein HOY80DRAFT_960344 [Tuber brumale]
MTFCLVGYLFWYSIFFVHSIITNIWSDVLLGLLTPRHSTKHYKLNFHFLKCPFAGGVHGAKTLPVLPNLGFPLPSDVP